MIKKPFKDIRFGWLADSEQSSHQLAPNPLGDLPWTDLGCPPEYGTVTYRQHILTLGMSFNTIRAGFTPSAFGCLVPGLMANVEFEEPTFQAVVLRGMRVICRERFPAANLFFSEGVDLFRHTDRYHSDMAADGSHSGTCHIVSTRMSVLDQLVGNTGTQALLARLNLQSSPTIAVRSVPLHVSKYLISGITSNLSGNLLKLHMHGNSHARERAQAIYDQLLACEGKLPTLDELAIKHGRSAKLLNKEFEREFGKSIFAFMIEYRLSQAHAALENTDISIKQLAFNLGYDHASNFTIAFKKMFGYPPGSLRRQKH
jgi:AraC-like DNA-binding protein